MKKKKIFLISFALVIFLCSYAYGMAGEGHKRVWNETFGFTVGNVENIWKTAQSVIDDYNRDYDTLKKNFKWFKLDSSGHRLLFHWGFNTNPQDYEPLVSLVKSCLQRSNLQAIEKDEQERKFFAMLNQMNARRKTALTSSIIGTLDTFTYAPIIASIIHDLHILADYSTVNVAGLPKIDDVQRDLINSFRTLAGNMPSEKLQSLEQKFFIEVNSPESDVHRKAAKIIEASKNYLPAVMNERFGENLNKKGIFIRNIDLKK